MERFDYRDFYLSAEGRVSRNDYWFKMILPMVGISILLNIISTIMPMLSLVTLISFPVILYVQFIVTIKRFHDFGQSGWWSLTLLLPFAVFVIGAIRGSSGKNEFGEDPLEAK
jgi:uncharacterized membrane protein YhaH (DUF805 family)